MCRSLIAIATPITAAARCVSQDTPLSNGRSPHTRAPYIKHTSSAAAIARRSRLKQTCDEDVAHKSIDQSTRPEMHRRAAQNPDCDAWTEIHGRQDAGRRTWIEVQQGRARHEQRRGIGEQVFGAAVQQGCEDNAQQARQLAWTNAEIRGAQAEHPVRQLNQPKEGDEADRDPYGEMEVGAIALDGREGRIEVVNLHPPR